MKTLLVFILIAFVFTQRDLISLYSQDQVGKSTYYNWVQFDTKKGDYFGHCALTEKVTNSRLNFFTTVGVKIFSSP